MKWETASVDLTGHSHSVTIDGETMTFAEAVSAYGQVTSMVIRQRIKRGWSLEDSFTKPLREDTNDWLRMTTTSKINTLKAFVADGLMPEQIVGRLVNVSAEQIAVYCGNHNINYGAARRRRDERPAEQQGERQWSKAVDGKGGPNPDGVRFTETNEDTCRWPLWAEPVGRASERLCCGQQTRRGPYCEAHAGKSKVISR